MTDQPTTEAGRALRDAIAAYGASTPSGTPAPHVLVGMRFMWGLGAIIDPAILAIEAEAVAEALTVERIAEALNACGLIRRYQEYAAATVTMEPITGPYLAHEWASALRIALLVKTGEPK